MLSLPSHLGPVPQDGDIDLSPLIFRLNLSLLIVSTLALIFRLIARAQGAWNYGWDDWTMLLAWIFSAVKFGISIAAIHYGEGRHIYYIPVAEAERTLYFVYISEFISLLAICFVKVSVALFLLRIGNLRRWLKLSLLANSALLVGSTFAFLIVLLVQCRPIIANWNLLAKAHAKCISPDTLIDVSYLTTDLVCAALPFPILWDLKISQRTKHSVRLVMCLGFIAAICGIVRITHVKDLAGTNDPTYSSVQLGLWTAAELYTGIIVGSLPPCRKLFIVIWAKATKTPPPDENTIGIQGSGSGRSIILQNLTRVGRAFTRSKTSPTNSTKDQASLGVGWQTLDNRPEINGYTASDRSIRPLVEFQNVGNVEDGVIWKTVGVTITEGAAKSKDEADRRVKAAISDR
ncbi:hypothetical protein BOTNAR_0063g00170 [Botryotinia narcissicola]|uniref:Rhodopsin domain-containing protein n=1 Tax=Botryotinia narcissicola TaxID=278944 RepID=A0A4Z1IY87_9HELO|nr:hypothetical protein BOTNAR_0063g00170 [Botryotinia narcissicola]